MIVHSGFLGSKNKGEDMLTQKRLKDLLHYDPETGLFKWANTGTGRKNTPGCKENGYLRIKLDGKKYLAHRLAWLYMMGEWPEHEIDHVNGHKSENRFDNLRDVEKCINIQNQRRASKNNAIGYLGVHAVRDKFRSSIRVKGKLEHLGYFSSPEEAYEAYVLAKRAKHEGCMI